jgi:hypothetical protein
MWRVRAWHGRADQAFELGERSVPDRTTKLDLGSCGDRIASRELVPFTGALADVYDEGDVPYG